MRQSVFGEVCVKKTLPLSNENKAVAIPPRETVRQNLPSIYVQELNGVWIFSALANAIGKNISVR